jgi:hypothetical protein
LHLKKNINKNINEYFIQNNHEVPLLHEAMHLQLAARKACVFPHDDKNLLAFSVLAGGRNNI